MCCLKPKYSYWIPVGLKNFESSYLFTIEVCKCTKHCLGICAQNVPWQGQNQDANSVPEEGFLFLFSLRAEDLLFTVFAGKHIRVWTGSLSAGLYRSPNLHPAHSAVLSFLTRANTLTFPVSSGLGLDLLKVRSNSNSNILL